MHQNFDFKLPEWAKTSTLYEVNIRQYTPEGTINAFAKHLPRLHDMGVEILWLMPIFPISTTKRKGSLGSYYSVSDFRAINEEIGTKEEFKNLVSAIHKLGMKVILDWVPNHTGWDHHWVKTNSEFYQKNTAGEIIDPIDGSGNSCGWEDVAGLNYTNPELRKAMIDDLLYWVNNHNIDGYRMDIAFLVPQYFWHEAKVALVKVKPDIYMLAEADRPEHLNEGVFHSCYGWSFHYIMNCIARGEKNVHDIEHWVWNEKSKMIHGTYMHFTSNHDENSWHGSEYERMGDQAALAFAVLTTLWDGIPLVYSGQEEPLRKRLEFFDKDDIGFEKYELHDFYKKMIHLKKQKSGLWNLPYGAHAHKISNHSQVYAFRREAHSQRVVVVLNLSAHDQTVHLQEDMIGQELFTTQMIEVKQGNPIQLKPWQYMVVS